MADTVAEPEYPSSSRKRPSPSKKRPHSSSSSASKEEKYGASDEQQSWRAKVKKLLGRDIYPLINLLRDLFEKDVEESIRSEAETLCNYAKKHYPNSLVPRICDLYLSTPFANTQRHCMTLLRRLLLQDGIWDANNFSNMARSDFKKRVFEFLEKQVDSATLSNLIHLVSKIGAQELSKQEWPLLLSHIFRSFPSTSGYEKHVALRLCKEMIPKCPEVFSPHIEVLGGLLDGLMDSNSYLVSASAIGAGLALIQQFTLAEAYQNYKRTHSYLNKAENKLVKAVMENEHSYARVILDDFLKLVENKILFMKLNISGLLHSMVVIAEISEADMRNRQGAIEFVLKVAENQECGCGMIQKKPEEVRRLLAVLVEMLEPLGDDLFDGDLLETESDDPDSQVSPAYSFAMDSLSRLANAVRGNVIGAEFLESLNQGLIDKDWKIRHKSVVTLGLISKGCSKIMVKDMQRFVDKIQNLSWDSHLRVRRRAIRTVAQFCKDFSPYLQEQFHSQLVAIITRAMDDYRNPLIQASAALAMEKFCQNCCPSTLKPYLNGIISKFVMFLQMENKMLKEATLTALSSVAASSKEDFLEYYDVVMSHLSVILLIAKKKVDRLLIAKTVDCITVVGLAVGKKFHSDAMKVIELMLQEPEAEMDGPVRCHLLQAWGRLCKSLGRNFLPFLSFVMPQLIRSIETTDLTVKANPHSMKDLVDDDSVNANNIKIVLQSDKVNSKASACNVFCWLAAELEEHLHMWMHEIEHALVPLVNSELHEEVRTAAISAMPLVLQAAVSATTKRLPMDGFNGPPVEGLAKSITTALLDALWKEPKTETLAKLLEALTACMQVAGFYLKTSQVKDFLDGMNEFLTTFAHEKSAKENRISEGIDLREKELLEEENKQEEEVYKKIGDCLVTFVKTHEISLLPFDEIQQFINRLWEPENRNEERNIGVCIFHVVAKRCQANSIRYEWDKCLPFLLKGFSHEDPEVQKAVARGLAICAEFGQPDFNQYLEDAIAKLTAIIHHPKALLPRKVMVHEAAIFALARICFFQFREIKTPEVFSLLLKHLPIKNDPDAAKIVHDQLCQMLGMAENNNIVGPDCANIPRIVEIFAEVLWADNHLATDGTIDLIKRLLNLFREQTTSETWNTIVFALPHYQQKMLERIL
ncbi:hypothetical protein M9H77_34159 [Catharanthus roseus]|uniref:Uncharacterized protein n=1 Tax=Catharanthus roseus TaxID=4058 RepID=A0ACB9ZKG4_CATRO|nr:hypothetical protein M9H77_34159 [Catharanthus roseus]